MRSPYTFWAIIMFAACMGGVARAGAWYVEQDGTGDFMVLQDAVEAAADGDTIFIGPGHYQDTHEYDPAGGSVIQVIVSWNDSRELFFIGEGRDQVFIGPDSYSFTGPYGFFHESGVPFYIEGVTFNFCRSSVVTRGGFDIRNCMFSDTLHGLYTSGSVGGGVCLLSNCLFFREQGVGFSIVSVFNASNVVIEGCYFENSDYYLQGVQSFKITNCESIGKIGHLMGSNGTYSNNHGEVRSNHALYVDSGSQVLIQDSVFLVSDGGDHNLSVIGGSTSVELLGNVFHGGYFSALYFTFQPTVVGEGNHFLREEGGYCLKLNHWQNPYVGNIDLRNNYWGTDDPDQVAEWIWDGVDDPELGLVQYLPIADGPMPTESMTLDGLKALYR